jgi:peptidoglycan/LPS O-acetylase OafA/YrhL
MLYPNIVPHRFNPRLVPPSWALTNELFFYLLISLGISKTYKRTMFWVILSVLYYVFTYKFYDLATFRYSAIPAASLPFSLGALLFWIVDKFKFSLKENYSLILLYLFLFYINGIWGSFLSDLSIYLNMIIGFFLIYELFKLKNKRIFKIDKYIGLYSYPVYLSHFLISIVYLYLFNQNSNTFKLNYESMPVYLILMFVFNFLLVHLIDIKIDQLKKNIKKSKLKT